MDHSTETGDPEMSMDDLDLPHLSDYEMLKSAALQLVETMDAGRDTSSARGFYAHYRARVDEAEAELTAWISTRES